MLEYHTVLTPFPFLLFPKASLWHSAFPFLPPDYISLSQPSQVSDHPAPAVQNSLPRAVVKALKSSHITPILWSLQWLKITECIKYKLLSLTYKVLITTQLSYLYNLITVSLLTALTLHLWSHSLVHPHRLGGLVFFGHQAWHLASRKDSAASLSKGFLVCWKSIG